MTFAGNGQPPVGSGPLLPLAVAQPGRCQVLVVGMNPVTDPQFDLAPQTFSGGWDLTGGGQPSSCTAEPAATPVTAPVPDTTSPVPVAPLKATSATTPTGMARTGRNSDRLAVIGLLAIAVGLGAVVGARRIRPPSSAAAPTGSR